MGKRDDDDNNDSGTDPTGWMVTFADLLMLLLTFFVMLLTMKSMDTGSMRELFASMKGSTGALTEIKSNNFTDMMQQTPRQDVMFVISFRMLERVMNEGVNAETEDVLGIDEDIISLSENEEGFIIRVKTDLGFISGQADIIPAMYPILDRLAEVLNLVANDIIIEGHTDNIPGGKGKYASNWELSMYRALNVHSYFLKKNLDAKRFYVGGYGSLRPLWPNDTEDGRYRNRRVEIILKRQDMKGN
ncbi:chemotaxis protein MotB [Candidatus Magnetomoraceae bacterium gMMP-1]